MDWRELKEKICSELEAYARNDDINARDLDTVHKLTDTLKNLYKIDMLKGSDIGSSYRMMSDSYSSPHWVRGHYSREAGDSFSREIHRFMDESNLNAADKSALSKALEIINR